MPKRESGARANIIEAASALIREHRGTESITTRDIAARAGVGVGLVNYHFQTKERLLNLCTQRIIGAHIGRFGSLYESLEMDPPAKLRFLVKENIKFLVANPGISWTSITHDLLSPELGDNTTQTLQAYLPVIMEVCGGKATEMEARVLLHALIFTMQVSFLRGGAFAESSGFDLKQDVQRDRFTDELINILFYKYL